MKKILVTLLAFFIIGITNNAIAQTNTTSKLTPTVSDLKTALDATTLTKGQKSNAMEVINVSIKRKAFINKDTSLTTKDKQLRIERIDKNTNLFLTRIIGADNLKQIAAYLP